MAKLPRPTFPHRRNPDGTFDSICTKCFATVATKTQESDLQDAEAAHICPGLDLRRILYPLDEK